MSLVFGMGRPESPSKVLPHPLRAQLRSHAELRFVSSLGNLDTDGDAAKAHAPDAAKSPHKAPNPTKNLTEILGQRRDPTPHSFAVLLESTITLRRCPMLNMPMCDVGPVFSL